MVPRFVLRVESAEGEVMWEAEEPDRAEVLPPAVAFVVTDLLREAVRHGTGAAAFRVGLPVPAAGKTGTTSDRHDAWFAGYTPDVVGTVWIGFDRPQPIVRGASGGRLAAPVWGRIVRELYRHRQHPGGWAPPDGVVLAYVDAATGERIAEGCAPRSGRSYAEAFVADSVPRAVCPGRQEEGLWARWRGWWDQAPRAGPAPPPAARAPLQEVIVIPAEELESGELSPRTEQRLREAERRLRARMSADERRLRENEHDGWRKPRPKKKGKPH